MDVRDLLGVVDAAALLDINPCTLRLWLRDGRLPYYRIGKRLLFDRKDLENFVEGCYCEPVGAGHES